MTTQALWRWEQDGAGGEHGTATFFPGTLVEVSMRVETFREAHALVCALATRIALERHNARQELLNEIARIKP
jgi:hypothetical protein